MGLHVEHLDTDVIRSCRTIGRRGCGPPRTPTTPTTPGPMSRPGWATSSCSNSPPPPSAASTAPSAPTPDATAKAWPPRRSATSTPCSTGPSRTPSASATWSATWPTPSPHHGAPPPSCRSGPHSSCGPSWPTPATMPVRPVAAGGHHRDAARRTGRAALDRHRPGRRSTLPPAAPGGGQLRGPRVRAQDPDGQAVPDAGPGHPGRPAPLAPHMSRQTGPSRRPARGLADDAAPAVGAGWCARRSAGGRGCVRWRAAWPGPVRRPCGLAAGRPAE
jgi:hypothetical protein